MTITREISVGTPSSLFLFCQVVVVCCLFAHLAESSEITFYGIGECEEPVESEVGFEYVVYDDPRSLDLKLNLPFDMYEDDGVHVNIHEMVEGVWKMNAKSTGGDVCTYLQQFLSKAWDKARDTSEPKIEEECHLPQGKYAWSGFQLSSDDVAVPPGMEGRFKLDVTFIKDDTNVFCTQVDLQVA